VDEHGSEARTPQEKRDCKRKKKKKIIHIKKEK
jgi:hypothetical protein